MSTPALRTIAGASGFAILVAFSACGDDETTGGGDTTSANGGSGATGNTGGAGAIGNTGGTAGDGGTGNVGNYGGNGPGPGNDANCDPAEGVPPAIALAEFATGFDAPLLITHAPGDDERLYVIQQGGKVILVKDGVNSTFLDIEDLANTSGSGERGLLGIAFHPNYVNNGRFFVHYSNNDNGNTTVQEFHRSDANPDVADPDPVRDPLLIVEQPFPNHNGGSIEFSPIDGYLYIFLGDGGSAGDPNGNGQNIDTLLAKVLRIDIDGAPPYAIPTGNLPGGAPEIWSFGVRNPYRSSFDACTGDMYIGDVGQNAFEEVNVEPAGQGNKNYGWNTMEASACYEPSTGCDQRGITLPLAEYPHAQGCSVTGGHVYRGSNVPGLRGTYFYGDYCSGTVWSFRYEGGAAVGQGIALETGYSIAGFGQDNRGEVYVVHRGSDPGEGTVYRIVAR